MSAIGPQFYEFIKKLDENGCKLPTSVTSRPFQPEFEFNNSSCYLCNGYYGPSFGEPVCVTCHEFLYPDIPHHLPTNLFSEKTEDGDSGNDEPSTGEIWYNDRKLTRALKKHGIPSWAFRLTWAELQSGEPAFRNVLVNRAKSEDGRDLPIRPNFPEGGPNNAGQNDGPSTSGGSNAGPSGVPNAGRAGGPHAGPSGGPRGGANAGPIGGPRGGANAGPNQGGPGVGANAGPNHGGPGGGAYGGPRGGANAGPNYGGPGGGANAGPNYGGPGGGANAGPNYGGPGGANAGPNHGGPGGAPNAGPNYGGPNYPFGFHGAGPYDDGTGPAVPDDGHIRPLSSYQECSLVALSTPRLPDNLAPGLVEQLPSEVLLCMFSYLDDLSLCACALVCARWHRLVLARVTQQRWAAYATRRWPLFRPMVNIHDWHKKYQALVESCFCRNCVVQMFMQTQPPFEENAWRRNRLRNEIKMLRNTPPEGCAATPLDPKCCHWQAMVTGPVGSPYEGGVFYLYIQVPYSYPMSPPLVRFVTRILHPNVSRHGDVGIDSVHHNWSLALTISKLLISIQSLLTDPYTAVCMEPEIGDMYVNDRVRFERIARRWTWRYAMHDMYSFNN